jgi:hypothetical protein
VTPGAPRASPSSPEGDVYRDSGWLARAQRGLAEREYQASLSRQGLQAPNRAQNLRTYFDPTGVRVVDRTAPGGPMLVELQLAGWGRGEDLSPASPGVVTSEGARVEIARAGLVEWYRNSAFGLEHGFDVPRRPADLGALILELRVAGASAVLDGEGVLLLSAAGRRLEYGKLEAFDADGKAVAAHLSVPVPDRIRLVVDDRGARYPLTIDPLLTATADAQVESDQADAELGVGVAGAGDVNGDGYADVIVGAPFYDAGQKDEGAAFVFLGSASGIASSGPGAAGAQLESDQGNARLGWSVAGAGDVNGDGYADVIVGAVVYDAGQGLGEGAAFVSGGPATASAQIEADQGGAFLGSSVAGAGDVNGDGYADVIVGATIYDAGENDEGAAFVFHGSASGIASGGPATAAAQLESDQALAQLGFSVAGAGDVNGDGYADVIVGAEFYGAGESNEGAAFVFHGSASGIASGNPSTADAQLESDQGDAQLGWSVAGAGDVNGDGYADVIVSAPTYDAGQTNEGAAWVFLGSASGIASGNPSTADAQLESDQSGGQLGGSVAGAGDVNGDGYADVMVGAPVYDGGLTDEGAAWVFLGSASGIASGGPATAAAQLESDQGDAQLGGSVAGAGDVNGDGYADVIVGANLYDAGHSDEGAAFVYHGGAQGIVSGNPAGAAAQLESDQAQAGQLGFSVAGAGDVNGDGYADVIVGVPGFDSGSLFGEGAAFVFHGSDSGIASANPATAAAQLESDQAGANLGTSVAGAGDVNGDGYADVIVGASEYDSGSGIGEGAAFVFHGSLAGIATGSPAVADAQLESNQALANLGSSVAGAGDVNGDGYADVIVGAPAYDAGQAQEGAAFVFHGSASGIVGANPATAAAQLESDKALAELGGSVAGAGDVNGDGYADVIAGAENYIPPFSGVAEGAAFVFHGSATGVASGNPATADAQLDSEQASAGLGSSVAAAGDVNGDGFADVIGAVAQPRPRPRSRRTRVAHSWGRAWRARGTSTATATPT